MLDIILRTDSVCCRAEIMSNSVVITSVLFSQCSVHVVPELCYSLIT